MWLVQWMIEATRVSTPTKLPQSFHKNGQETSSASSPVPDGDGEDEILRRRKSDGRIPPVIE